MFEILKTNLFDHYQYGLWAPDNLLELSFESAIRKLDTEPSLDAAFVVFWTILDTQFAEDYEGLSKGDTDVSDIYERILSQLVQNLRPDDSPDSKIGDVEAWIFVLVSSAAAVHLKRHDSGKSERFWELIGDSISILSRPNIHPYCEQVESGIPHDLVISNYLVKVWLLANQFERFTAIEEDEDALRCLYEASSICRSVDFEIAEENEYSLDVDTWMALQYGYATTFSAEGDKVDNQPPGPAMRVRRAGYHLAASIVAAQQAVDAFERLLHKNPSKSVDWKNISRWCEVIPSIWNVNRLTRKVRSEFFRSPRPSRAFWDLARGAALQKMNPGDLVNVVNELNESGSGKRLRTYFFGDIWNDIPESSRQALISADNEFMASEGRRVGVFNNLRLAVEPIIDEKLVIPFKKWLDLNCKEFVSEDSKSLRLSRQISELSELNSKDFYEFAELYIANMDAGKWDNLFNDLKALRDIRNDADHPEQDNVPQSKKIEFQYQKFFGINRRSVIRLLMECNVKEPM